MSDVYHTSKTVSYGSRIKNSFVGVLLGIALFLGSFFVLYFNEGTTDLSSVAETAVPIESSVVSENPELQGQLVSTAGTVTSPQQLGDSMFFQQGDYLQVERVSEMYSWVEKKTTSKKKNLGGSETQDTTYEYTKEWTDEVPSSSGFYQSGSYYNPVKQIDSQTMTVSKASIGKYQIQPKTVTFPEAAFVPLSSNNIDLPEDMTFISDDYLYNGIDYNNPEVGDIRVSYQVVRAGQEMTLFGSLNDNLISSYTNQDGDSLYRLFYEDTAGAIAVMHSEFTTSLWMFRLIGFLMMWFGMLFVLRPITVLLDVVPIFGSISGFAFFFFTLPIAVLLSLLTIVISLLFHNIVITMIVAVVAIVVTLLVLMRRNKKTAAPAA
ncbi:MAG: TMEM43 family protein [Candidatus Uhrbacteria bacterium]